MSDKYCDVLIAGTDLAGLIAGAFLAKRGLSVTVLNFDKDISTEKKSIQPNLITHLDSKLFKNIMGRLSIVDHELGIARRLSVPYQVVLPQHRIDVSTDRDLFERELQREFPDDFEQIKEFYNAMDLFESLLDTETLQNLILPKGIKEVWNFKRFIKNSGLSERLSHYTEELEANKDIEAFLDAQLRFLSSTYSENPFTYVISKLLSNDNCVLYEVKGGVNRLKKIFIDKIESYSGLVKNNVQIENLEIEGRKVRGMKLSGFEGNIGCRYLLWNQKIREIEPFVPQIFWNRRLLHRISNIKPKLYHFTIRYDMNEREVPEGMRENLLYIANPDLPLTGSNFFHINVFRPDENKPSGRIHLMVSYLLEAESLHSPKDFLGAIHDEITAHLRNLMPFSNSLLLSFPIASKQNSELNQGDNLLFALEKEDFEIFRENAQENPVYELSPRKFEDLFPLKNRTHYKNLFFTSPEVLASLGFEGKFLLGLKTIDIIWKEIEMGRKKAIKQRKIA